MPYFHLPYFRRFTACLLAMLLSVLFCQAQVKPQQKPDTLQTESPADTARQQFDDRIMGNLKEISERKTIVGKALKAVLRFNRRDYETRILDAELIQREYERHNYKIVRAIHIVTLNPFGYSVNDRKRIPRNFFEKAGNSLHVKTKHSLVRNKVLFRVNEPIRPLDLIESERLLRQTPYLLDARIAIDETTATSDSVDILVTTKDVFSLGGSGSYSPSSGSGRIAPREVNFLGLGHQLRTSYRFNMDRPQPWELSTSYTIENIGRSYISAAATYINQNDYQERSAYLYRTFFSTNTKYAGSIGFNQIEERLLLPSSPTDTVPQFGKLGYTRYDGWFGRSFRFKSYHLGHEPLGRVIVGVRAIHTNYTTKPTENFQDNLLMLGSVGYSVRRYFKDRFLFGFGRIEDVPAGTFVSFTGGYEQGVITSRPYAGADISFAKYGKAFGYLYARAAFGSYFRNQRWEQGVLDLEGFYFSKLSEWGNWKLRHFAIGRGTIGVNRHPEELLSINQELGLRGFRSDYVRGSRRVALNYEANLYTPFSLFGFRLATVLFADVAWITTGNKKSPFSEAPYRGYGIGFRFRNEFLSFSTIQILLGYYPKLPANENIKSFRIFNTTRPYYDFEDFRFEQPGVATFR